MMGGSRAARERQPKTSFVSVRRATGLTTTVIVLLQLLFHLHFGRRLDLSYFPQPENGAWPLGKFAVLEDDGSDRPKHVDNNDETHPVSINMTNILWSRNWNALATCASVPEEYYTLENVRTWCRHPYTTECVHKPDQLKEWFLGCQPDTSTAENSHLVLWVRLQSHQGDLSLFIEHVLPLMEHPFELITTDGDSSVPSQIKGAQQLLSNPLLLKWHTQNYDGTVQDPKLHPIPIGLDLHTVGAERKGLWSTTSKAENLRQMKLIREDAFLNRGNRRDIFWVPPMNVRNDPDRTKAYNAAKCLNHTYSPHLSVPDLYKAYTQYKFGFSPRGNGLDAHRTWEMLFFGMIPIVRTGPMDSMYDGLPVLIVQKWEDICEPGMLDRFYEKWADRVPVSDTELTMQYFFDKG